MPHYSYLVTFIAGMVVGVALVYAVVAWATHDPTGRL